MSLVDEFRFAVGTLTRLPVPPPTRLDGRIAGRALAVSPIVGAGIGLVTGLPLIFGDADLVARLITGTLTLALAAWATRALHWDGLADLADGLGSGQPPAGALAVMRRSDIGPFGVLTMGLVAALQVLCIARLPSGAPAFAGWLVALAAGRLAVAAAAATWVRPARTEGLGALVVGSVTPRLLALATGLMVVVGGVQAASGYLDWTTAVLWVPLTAIAVALVVARTCSRRLGGSTGDVLGATAELATLATLLVMALG